MQKDNSYQYIANKGLPKVFTAKLTSYIGGTLAFLVLLFPLSLLVILLILVIRAINKFLMKLRIKKWSNKYTHEIDPPNDLRPIELGVLYDRQVTTQDLMSLLFI